MLSRAIIDNYINGEEEDYPLTPYEYRFYNYHKEKSETKRLAEIELDELVDIRLPKELREYISLLNKEIKRLNHFRIIESARLEELDKENKRLKEENFKLAHLIRRGRGRPRKNN